MSDEGGYSIEGTAFLTPDMLRSAVSRMLDFEAHGKELIRQHEEWRRFSMTAIVGEYFRNLRGDIVHLAPCSRMGNNAVPWEYMKEKSLREVVDLVHRSEWMRLCRTCWPEEARWNRSSDSSANGKKD